MTSEDFAPQRGAMHHVWCVLTLQLNKEDLVNMVRYGAELVFSSEASSITDAGVWVWVWVCTGGGCMHRAVGVLKEGEWRGSQLLQ
jgi:hypothetical protein